MQTPIEELQKSNPDMVLMDLPEDFDPKQQHFFQVMDQKAGDYKIIWNRHKDDEVKQARQSFDNLKKKGYSAYSVSDDGEKKDKITEFDENAERIIMVPPVRAG